MLKTVSVPGSIGYLMENICPDMSNPPDCETKVGQWWGYMSQIAFNDQIPKYFCSFTDTNCISFTGDSFMYECTFLFLEKITNSMFSCTEKGI